MKIALIYSNSFWSNDKRVPFSIYNQTEPLGILSIASFLEYLSHEVRLFISNHNNDDFQSIIDGLVEFQPDVICFSCMTIQVNSSHLIASKIKNILPQAIAIVGGDHFSAYPQDIVNFKCFDVAIAGEGEYCIKWILDNLNSEWQAQKIPNGIYWRDCLGLRGKGIAKRIQNINKLPFPKRLSPLLTNNTIGKLMYPPYSSPGATMSSLASRGCPFNCSYCDAAQIWGRKVIWRNISRVLDELRLAKENYGVNKIFFVDLTFNADRDKLLSFCDVLCKENLGIYWYVLLRPGVPDSQLYIDMEILNVMKSAGCVKIGFGVETISDQVSEDLNRSKGNGHLVEMCRYMDELGILSKAFFIIGHPSENEEYYNSLYEYLLQLRADEIRASFLTPFPGTQLWRQYKNSLSGGINYDLFDTFHPLIHHPIYSQNELQSIRLNLMVEYYKSNDYCFHIENKTTHHPHLKESYNEFIEYINSQCQLVSFHL